jgi:hypothetical protein
MSKTALANAADSPDAPINLTKGVYAPAMLATELAPFVSEATLRKQVRNGALKAHRIGGKKIIIFREDVVDWFRSLPLATEPTSFGSRDKRKQWPTPQMIGQEAARERRKRKLARES